MKNDIIVDEIKLILFWIWQVKKQSIDIASFCTLQNLRKLNKIAKSK